jgi:hypothetical protein
MVVMETLRAGPAMRVTASATSPLYFTPHCGLIKTAKKDLWNGSMRRFAYIEAVHQV